jgi:hypothetical protein
MKRTITPEAREKLHNMLARHIPVDDHIQMLDIAEKIIAWYEEQNTFTDAITTDEKTCPTCGSLWVISKRYLPRYLVRPLRILAESARALTTKELTAMTGNRQVYTKFAWLVHWGLIEKVEKSTYIITEKGMQFLRAEITVPEFLWMLKNKVVETPQGEETPQRVFHYQLSPTDTDDHAEHVERAAPASSLTL